MNIGGPITYSCTCGTMCFSRQLLQLHQIQHDPNHILFNQWTDDGFSHVFEDEIYLIGRTKRCDYNYYYRTFANNPISQNLCYWDRDAHPKHANLNPRQ